MASMKGATQISASVEPARSNARLRTREERDRPKRRTPSIVRPSRWSNSTDEPTTSSRCGSTETRTPACLARRIMLSVSPPWAEAGAMMTRCTLWRATSSSNGSASEVWRSTGDRGDDLGVDAALAQLLAHDRDRVGRAGHEAALRRHRGADGPARESAQSDEQRERRAPDDEDVARVELHGGETVVHEPQQQRVDRGHLQQPRRLVERGLVQDQLVALVQAADLADQDDRRRGDHAEHEHGVVDEQREHGDDDEHRRRGVGDRERAPVEPLADRGGRPERALGDRLAAPPA